MKKDVFKVYSILTIAICVWIIVGYFVWQTCNLEEKEVLHMDLYPELSGMSIPDFALNDLDGEKHTLSDYRGQNVVVVVWFPWAKQCRAQIDTLNKLQDKYGDDELKILAITYTSNGNTRDLIKSVAEKTIDPNSSDFKWRAKMADYSKINYTVLLASSKERKPLNLNDKNEDLNRLPVPWLFNSVTAFPMNFYINPEGQLKQVTAGLIPLEEIVAVIESETRNNYLEDDIEKETAAVMPVK